MFIYIAINCGEHVWELVAFGGGGRSFFSSGRGLVDGVLVDKGIFPGNSSFLRQEVKMNQQEKYGNRRLTRV